MIVTIVSSNVRITAHTKVKPQLMPLPRQTARGCCLLVHRSLSAWLAAISLGYPITASARQPASCLHVHARGAISLAIALQTLKNSHFKSHL
jgi:hypothetical protein